MSRIGKLPMDVPSGTTVTIEGQLLKAKGPKGELSMELPEVISAELEGAELRINPRDDLVNAANEKIRLNDEKGRKKMTFAQALDASARTLWGNSRSKVGKA